MKDEQTPPITARLLLQAYASGVFPMAESAGDREIFWVDPKRRGIIPLDGLNVSRSLRKAVLRQDHRVAVNTAFRATVAACADRSETWINDEILDLYCELNQLGFAHSVEIWADDELVGGLYGVCIGGAFFGESMFSAKRDASKIALVHLVARLREGGFGLLDTQFVTDHLKSLGAVEISRSKYHKLLNTALNLNANFWALPRGAEPYSVLQRTTQTS